MLNIWENNYVPSSHQNQPNTRSPTVKHTSYRPTDVFKQAVLHKSRAENKFLILLVQILCLLGREKFMVYRSFTWKKKRKKLAGQWREHKHTSGWTAKDTMAKASTCKVIQASIWSSPSHIWSSHHQALGHSVQFPQHILSWHCSKVYKQCNIYWNIVKLPLQTIG